MGHQGQPLPGPHCKCLSIQIIDGALRCHRGQYESNKAHIMVIWEPGYATVAGLDPKSGPNNAFQIVQDRFLGNDHPAREMRASRCVLNIGRLCGPYWKRLDGALGKISKCLMGAEKPEIQLCRGLGKKFDKFFLGHGNRCLAIYEQSAQMRHIIIAAAHGNHCGKGDRHQAGVLAGKKEVLEVRMSVCHQRNPGTTFQPQAVETEG